MAPSNTRRSSVIFLAAVAAALLALPACGGGGDGDENDSETGSTASPGIIAGEGDITYVAIGASDAAGIGALPPTRGYVYQIENGLEDRTGRDVDLINLGFPGIEIEEMREIQLPAAKLAGPDLVTIWAGPNDLIRGEDESSFRADLEDILQELTTDTQAQVLIATIPDMTRLPRFQTDPDPDVTPERISAFNAAIIDLAASYGAQLVDLRQVPLENVLVSEDGFHPSNEGHERIAELFLQELR